MKQSWGFLLNSVLLPVLLAALSSLPQILASAQSSSAPKTLPVAPSNLDFDNMGDRPITAADWRSYEIVGDVNEDAAVLNFGMMVIGSGKAWLDNVALDDLGKTTILSDSTCPAVIALSGQV